MKKFRNIKTGIVEVVKNEKLIEQYEKHNEVYELVKDKKNTNKQTQKTDESKVDEANIDNN